MKRFFRWLLVSSGYLLYTVVVIVFLLWFLFPAQSVLVWLQKKLDTMYPSLTWEIKDLEKGFPLNVKLTDVLLSGKNGRNEKLFQIDTLQVTPDINTLMKLKKQIPVLYKLDTLDGTIKGKLVLSDNRTFVQCSGEAKGLEIGKLDTIWQRTDRSGSGKMSGSFNYQGRVNNFIRGDLRADLQVMEGSISLRQKILGQDQLDFKTLKTTLNMKDMVARFEDGAVDSRLFTVGFKGTLHFTDSLYTSRIAIQGFMEPRPELFGGLENAAAVSFIRNQLQDNRLSFNITGPFLDPGIIFKGASGIIDGIIEGGVR